MTHGGSAGHPFGQTEPPGERALSQVVVVLPTYNEIGNLETIADALLGLALPDAAPLRLLIVDDASSDGTAAAADALARRHPGRVEVLHRRGKRGLGSAYLAGFAQVLGGGVDLIVQMDADLSHDPAILPALVAAARDADLVIGSRYVTGGSVDTTWGWYRKWLSGLANRRVVPTLLALPVRDATGGYRVWRREALARIAPSVTVHSSGYGFQVEMAYLAHRLGGRIREVPIHFRQRTAGRSKMSGMVALTAIIEIFAVRARHGTPRAACADPRREIST